MPGAEPVAVLTDGLWQRLFGGSPAAIGQVLRLDGRPHTVVGVLPATFSMPMSTTAELWVGSDRGIPRSFPFPGDITTVRDSHFLTVIGRLADDASRDVAGQELASIMSRLARTFPDTNEGLSAQVIGLHEAVVGDVRPLVVLLQLAVALMLCIGCANVANLILGQAAGRQAELARRVALGASRGRLVRQLAAETLVIAVPGGLVGLLIAAWGLDALLPRTWHDAGGRPGVQRSRHGRNHARRHREPGLRRAADGWRQSPGGGRDLRRQPTA